MFGSDEERMIVLSDDFEAFLDLTIQELKGDPMQFSSSNHVHEVYKRIKVSN